MSPRVYRLLPVYLVVFVGFLGYSLMIAVSTPMMLRNDNGVLPPSSTTAQRSVGAGRAAGAVSPWTIHRVADSWRPV